MRIPAATVLVVLALSLAACGGDDEVRSGGSIESETSASESNPPDATETAPTDTDPPAACDLADEADVEAAYGEDIEAGSPGGGSQSENDVVWQSDNCTWSVEDGLEVKLQVSVADDYEDSEDGALLCPELASFGEAGTPVPELGDGASWVIDGVDPNEGTLRVCLDEVNFDIDMEQPDGSRDADTMRDQTVALAQVVLASVG